MAISDTAVLAPAVAHFYTAVYNATTPVGLPTDLTAPGASWTEVGHTSLDNILAIKSTGGTATTLGTLQNPTLRTSYSARSETFTFNLEQFDQAGLKLYYGSNATVGTAGEIQVPANPTPTIATFLVVFFDGTNHFAFYAPKAEIFRDADLNINKPHELANLPIGVTPLQSGTNTWTYAVTPLT